MDHATHLPPLASAREISEDARAYILSGDEAGLSAAWRVLEARGCLCARAANEADLLKEFASCNKKRSSFSSIAASAMRKSSPVFRRDCQAMS